MVFINSFFSYVNMSHSYELFFKFLNFCARISRLWLFFNWLGLGSLSYNDMILSVFIIIIGGGFGSLLMKGYFYSILEINQEKEEIFYYVIFFH